VSTLESLDEVVDAVNSIAVPGRRTIVALVGSPGAGKSTIAAGLVQRLGDAALVPMDGFHLRQERLVELGRRDRMGAPDTFDVEAFLETLTALRGCGNSGILVPIPGFDRELEQPIPNAEYISPEFPKVVVEGNYLLLGSGGWERAAAMFDLSFFVELDRDIRLRRLIARHERFGKSTADAVAWATGPDEANARVIEATASRADHVIRLG
jgi:pantothenate kinase